MNERDLIPITTLMVLPTGFEPMTHRLNLLLYQTELREYFVRDIGSRIRTSHLDWPVVFAITFRTPCTLAS